MFHVAVFAFWFRVQHDQTSVLRTKEHPCFQSKRALGAEAKPPLPGQSLAGTSEGSNPKP